MAAVGDVVITGLGIVSPIGIGRAAFDQSLRDRVSGVGPIKHFDSQHLEVRIGAELKDFEPKLYVKPRKSLKVMSREIQMGVSSATLAVEDADLDVKQVDVERFGVVYGSPMLYADIPELVDLYRRCVEDGSFDFDKFGGLFPKQMLPLWMLKYLPNMTASHIGIANGARGPNNSVVHGDCSSLLAMIEAITVIQRGLADVMLTGGAGDRMNLTAMIFRSQSDLSHRNDAPTEASRPFDADRDGMVIGEGAATIVLEERSHAESRGAKILGTVIGYSTVHQGTPSSSSMENAIFRSVSGCLRQANISADEVGHVNAHGLSDKRQDAREARAIRAALGDVPVTAPKSYFGNVGAASGVLELAASLVTRGVPATLNYSSPEPACPINVAAEAQPFGSSIVLKLSQNSTGQCVGLLVKRD